MRGVLFGQLILAKKRIIFIFLLNLDMDLGPKIPLRKSWGPQAILKETVGTLLLATLSTLK